MLSILFLPGVVISRMAAAALSISSAYTSEGRRDTRSARCLLLYSSRNSLNRLLADSFARIFYRNAINIGLPILECESVSKKIDDGDTLQISLKDGLIEDISKGIKLRTNPVPGFLMEIMEKGLVEYIKERRRKT